VVLSNTVNNQFEVLMIFLDISIASESIWWCWLFFSSVYCPHTWSFLRCLCLLAEFKFHIVSKFWFHCLLQSRFLPLKSAQGYTDFSGFLWFLEPLQKYAFCVTGFTIPTLVSSGSLFHFFTEKIKISLCVEIQISSPIEILATCKFGFIRIPVG